MDRHSPRKPPKGGFLGSAPRRVVLGGYSGRGGMDKRFIAIKYCLSQSEKYGKIWPHFCAILLLNTQEEP